MSGSYALASNRERPASVPGPSASGVESDDEYRLQGVVERLSGMGNAAFVAHPLPGGLTNHNYRVDTAGGRTMVVRLSSPQSSVLTIAREDEYLNSRAAAAAGVAPQVLGYLPELSALVLDWIEGQTFDSSDLDDSATLRQVAATCRQLHSGPRFATDFDMFALTRRYLDVVLDNGYRLPQGYLTYRPQMDAIEQAMAQSPQPQVPCHNDLLPANMMSGGGRLWFIDFEYAGNGDPCFELGNLCSEAHLSTERLEELIAAYYGTRLACQGRPRSPARPDVELRLDAVGLHPGGHERAGFRLLGLGSGEVRTGRCPVPQPRPSHAAVRSRFRRPTTVKRGERPCHQV